MGLEANCRCEYGGQRSEGRLQLESAEVLFRGGFRLKVPTRDIRGATADRGWLRLDFGGGTARFELGDAAAKWAHKILHPPSRLDKLGVKTGMRVGVMGSFAADFLDELRARSGDVSMSRLKTDCALVLLLAESKAGLERIPGAAGKLAKTGGLWVVYPKGIKPVTESDVLAAGRAAGLVDVKVASFSETQTGLKFVIPVKNR